MDLREVGCNAGDWIDVAMAGLCKGGNEPMYLKEVGCDDKDWITLAEDRAQWRANVRAAMDLRVP